MVFFSPYFILFYFVGRQELVTVLLYDITLI